MDDFAFEPTRSAALERLQRFVPLAGSAYASERNYDHGAGRHDNVSVLSPYLRTRLITEDDVLTAVLGRFSPKTAEKFVQEVYWRTYFKGWLEHRPSVWTAYRASLSRHLDDVHSRSGLRQVWEDACTGNTGIACFDSWADELVRTGYLHNHARMWFASIWIFTLNLPWELGADFFLRHLADADPASNTLSWRWVGGLHTQGKHYLARAWNIKRYTNGRFDPDGSLNETAGPLPFVPHPPRIALPQDDRPPREARIALILHEEDLSPGNLIAAGQAPVATATVVTRSELSPLMVAPQTLGFSGGAIADTISRWSDRIGPVTACTSVADLATWAASTGAEAIVAPYAPAGPTQHMLTALRARLADQGQSLHLRLRRYDAAAWPHATAGFFKLKEKIPGLLVEQRNRAA